MTAQVHDTLLLDDTRFYLCEIEGTGLFEAEEAGIEVGEASSACWRGYRCHYRIAGEQLVLQHLQAAVKDTALVVGDASATALQRKATKLASKMFGGFDVEWRDLAHPVPFSGGMLVGDGFIQELYVHMGGHPALKFKRVRELVFDAGRLKEQRRLDAEMAQVRSAATDVHASPEAAVELLDTVIKTTFSRGYTYSLRRITLPAVERQREERSAARQAAQKARRIEETAGVKERSAPILAALGAAKDGAIIQATCPRCGDEKKLRVCEGGLVMCYKCYWEW